MMQFAPSPIVADINHRICQAKGDWVIFLFALSDNLISEDWFFAEGERFLSTESNLTLLTLIFGVKKDPMKRNSSGLLVILGK